MDAQRRRGPAVQVDQKKLLHDRERLELEILKNSKKIDHKKKQTKDTYGRRISVDYDNLYEKEIWRSNNYSVRSGLLYIAIITTYEDGSPKYHIEAERTTVNGKVLRLPITRQLFYEEFIVVQKMFLDIGNIFEQEYRKYVANRRTKTKQRLEKEFKFDPREDLDEVVDAIKNI